MKILVIEDSERLRRSLGRGLGKAGFAFAETYEYAAIVLDLMLPGVPGLEVLRRLRAAGSAAHVLILSAKDRVEDRVKGLEMGADDYLVNPFAFDELCSRRYDQHFADWQLTDRASGATGTVDDYAMNTLTLGVLKPF